MVNLLTKFICDMKTKKQADLAYERLLDGQMTKQEANYVRKVVAQALGRQAVQEQNGDIVDELSTLIACHKNFTKENPNKIKGLDTFGLVSEALGTIKDKNEMLDEIQDHGVRYAEIRILSAMVNRRHLRKMSFGSEFVPEK